MIKRFFKKLARDNKLKKRILQRLYLLCFSYYVYFAFGVTWQVIGLYLLIGVYGLIFDK
ncbi:hypothetical protein [uncultured Lactococcus sp.]|uniref:hypothetical protein n=1 Tax=uncultured Lactococcus sp. TaxID=167973 RepID=UPI0027DCBFF7|nr:hypothetical protein [uncultured Lactococcus sp.]